MNKAETLLSTENIQVRIYTVQFWLLCVSSLLFFASFNMIIPELPGLITQMGGAEHKGLIISLFTLTAMISRPFSGKLADNIGRVPVIVFGAVVCVLCSLVYPFLTSLYGFFLLRLVHGFSTGFTPTGHAAYLSDIIPEHRRGEAMGLLGTAGTLGMACGPAIGAFMAQGWGLDSMFYFSSLCGLLSVLIVMNIRETLKERQPFSMSVLRIQRKDIFEPRVLLPCLIMVLSVYPYGAIFTLIPDFGIHVGIQNKGLLFTYFTIASLIVRLIAGKASDILGRVPVLRFSVLIIMAAMVVMSLADSQWMLIAGIVLYGLGQGSTSPTLIAWATDLSDTHHKGRGLASLYIFMEMGIGLGAFISGMVFGDNNFFIPFILCAGFSSVALLLLFTSSLLSRK